MSSDQDETTAFRPKFGADGLLPALAIDAETGEALMLAYMNADALNRTLETGEVHYWSRSRGELWHKGATSGHTQQLVEMRVDCDQDTLILRVRQAGAACHTGRQTCFYRTVIPSGENGEDFHDRFKLAFREVS